MRKPIRKVQNPRNPIVPTRKKKIPNDKSAVDDRRRTMLLGKKAARTITADNGEVIVSEGAEITEEVLQKAKLANKYIELSMNYTA